jgi:hypothetical protein
VNDIRFLGTLTAVLSAGLIIGAMLRLQPIFGSNDASRWNTVWSLTHGKGYIIDGAPYPTVDKVKRDGHFYSSKPALMPTVLAGLAWPLKAAEWTLPEKAAMINRAILLVVNVLPFAVFILLYARYLDRRRAKLTTRLYCLGAAAFGTYLTAYSTTLNNHTQAAWSVFFALYNLVRIKEDGQGDGWRFALCGLFTAWTVANEMLAVSFALPVLVLLLRLDARKTFIYFVPTAAVLGVAFLVTTYLSTGGLVPYYLYSSSDYYKYEDSYWLNPTGIDAANEPKWLYLFHLLLGHHGMLSLTPVFLISLNGMGHSWRRDWVQQMGLYLSLLMIGFYTLWTSNYGGACQGPRWLFWLIPFWLISLIDAVEQHLAKLQFRALASAALLVSVASVGYALTGDNRSFEPPGPWSSSWLHLAMRKAGWVTY